MTRALSRLVLGGVVLSLLACGDDEETAAKADERTSGAEITEPDSMAKRVAKSQGTQQAEAATPAAPKPAQDFSPTVGPAPKVPTSTGPKKPTGPSPWGAPDAQAGTPLPSRPKLAKNVTEAIQRGHAAAAKGDFAGAKVAYEQALALDARAFQAAYDLGVIADRQGQTNQALQAYSRALRIQADYERAAEATVNLYLRQGNAAQAVAFIQPLAQRWQRNLFLQAILANALVEANRVDEGEQAARAALRRDERFVPAMIALANACLRRGRIELADSILEQALAIDPKQAELHFLLGMRHKQEGRAAPALESYRKAVELRGDYVEARMALGLLYMGAGNYVLAVEQFEALARIAPTLVAVHLNLGDSYRASRRFAEAKKSFDQALRMQPTLPEAHFNLGLMYMEAGADFPGLSLLDALQRSVLELTTYRDQQGPRLAKDDPSTTYLTDLQRQIEREKKRIEREAARKKKEAERGARQPAGK